MLDFWEMQSTPSLPSLQGPLRPRMVTRDRVLSKGQIELFDLNYIQLFEIEQFEHLTVCKQMTDV